MSAAEPRLRASSRITGALWGAIVAATGATTIAVFSGAEIDLELLVIVMLAAVGAWLLLSALATGFRRHKAPKPSAASPNDDDDLLGSAQSQADAASTASESAVVED